MSDNQLRAVVNLYTNKLVKILGLVENTERFCNVALYQGKTTMNIATGEVSLKAEEDPTLVCTAHRKQRFYLFTRREPDDGAKYEHYPPCCCASASGLSGVSVLMETVCAGL